MDPNDNTTPPATPPEDQVPSWAQNLIDQNADLADRLSTFEERLQPPEPPVVEPPTDEWKPSSWQDVDARAEEKAKTVIDNTLAEREAEAQASTEAQANAVKEIDTYLDSQVDELTKDSKLPTITNENDPNDPGKLARRELYGFALSLGTTDLKNSHNTLDALHKAGKQFDFVKMELVDKNPSMQGAQSPVGSSSAGASGMPTKVDYKTLHNNSLDALASRFGPE